MKGHSYCNWHSGTVHLDGTEYTCHSDKQDFIFMDSAGNEVRMPSEDAEKLRDNLNHYLSMGKGYAAARVLQFEGEKAKLTLQVGEAKHRLQTMKGVLDKALKALE
jgi:hypothetical protein